MDEAAVVAQRDRIEEEKISWVKAKQNPVINREKKKKEEFDARGKELREKYKETKEINLETVY